MPARIEHKIVNGKECKWCPKCEEWKELDEFHTTNNRTWDNRFYMCMSCYNEKRNDQPMPKEVYRKMIDRCNRDKDYLARGTKVLISEADFCKWYEKNWFKGCFVDRIDNQGHYEAGNIQTITRTESNYKRRQDRLEKASVTESPKTRYCFECSQLLSIDDFYRKARKINKNNPLGLDEVCAECVKRKRNEYYERTKK
jgi:hypothetical protein